MISPENRHTDRILIIRNDKFELAYLFGYSIIHLRYEVAYKIGTKPKTISIIEKSWKQTKQKEKIIRPGEMDTYCFC